VRAAEILKTEIYRDMVLLGVNRILEMDETLVVDAP
jgi:hypothetical protein